MEKNLSYKDCLLLNLNSPEHNFMIEEPILRLPPGLDIEKKLIPLHLRQDRKYPILDNEINKIRALSSFKNNLIEHIMRYFRSHKIYHGGKLKYIRRQISNHFTNWFFKANMDGNVVNFIPLKPLEVQINLNYIFDENYVIKKADFDEKMLTFNPQFIKDLICVKNIVINNIPKVNNTLINIRIINNGDSWSLLPITQEQFTNLKNRYIGPQDRFDEYCAILMLRYKFLGGINNHLSIPPLLYHHLKITRELFGSPFNVITQQYCSPFPDIESKFGSIGTFQDHHFESNQVYAANPPYDVQIVGLMAQKLNDQLSQIKNTVVYVVIPLWRKDFPGYNLLKNSQFLRDECELDKLKYPFYHYFKGRLIPASHTYLMVLSTNDDVFYHNCASIRELWPKQED